MYTDTKTTDPLTVACPFCGADAGSPCQLEGYDREPHQRRRAAATGTYVRDDGQVVQVATGEVVRATRRITVTMTLDIDPAAWALEYGLSLDEVESDVEEHAVNTVVGHFSSLGLLAGDN